MDPPNPNPNFSALIDPREYRHWGPVSLAHPSSCPAESYARNRQQIERARMYINQVEAQNEAAFNAFTDTEQELQRRIREGLEAQWVLSKHQVVMVLAYYVLVGQDASDPTQSRKLATVSLRWPVALAQLSLNLWTTKADVHCTTASSSLLAVSPCASAKRPGKHLSDVSKDRGGVTRQDFEIGITSHTPTER